MTKRNIAALAAVLLAAGIAGCGGDDGGGGGTPGLTNFNTGPVPSVPAAGAVGTRTLLPATADTHEVETDGNWIVWKARQINLGYYNGSTYANLDLGLPGSVTPWAFNYEPYESPIAYDGDRIAFVANDVSDAAVAAFYYGAPGSSMRKIALPDTVTTQTLGEFEVILAGNVAAVIDESATPDALYVADLGAAAPAFAAMDYTGLILTFDNEPVTGGGRLALSNGGAFALLDLATGVQTALTGDGNVDTSPVQARYANGAFTWVEGTNAYFRAPGFGPSDSTLIAVATVPGTQQSNPVSGPWGTYVLWQQGTAILQRSWAQLGGALVVDDPATTTVNEATFRTHPPILNAAIAPLGGLPVVRTGMFFIAWLGTDANGDTQLFTYYVGQPPPSPAVVQVTSDPGSGGNRSDDRVFLIVDGSKVFYKQQFTNLHSPGRVLKVFDYATQSMKTILDERDFQQVPVVAVASGKAITLTRDHSFRLFAKKAGSSGAPVVVTPASQDVKGFQVADGQVAYAALDRALYLDSEFLHQYVIDGGSADFLIEIHAHDLDAGGAPKRLTWNWSEDDAPQTDGRWVTWRDAAYSLAYAMSLGELTPIPIGETGDKVPVAGGLAAWRDYDSGNVFYANLATPGETTDTETTANYCPAVAGGLVAWQDGTNAYYVDTSAATPELVTIADVYPEGPVDTDGRFLTWKTYRSGWDHDGDGASATPTPPIEANVVVVHDTTTDETLDVQVDFTLTGYMDPGGDQGPVCYPKVTNGVVVFGATEYGSANVDFDMELYKYDAAAATPALVRLTNDPDDAGLWDSNLSVGGNLVVFRTGGSSYWDWDGKVPAVLKLK